MAQNGRQEIAARRPAQAKGRLKKRSGSGGLAVPPVRSGAKGKIMTKLDRMSERSNNLASF
ncbi:hypothetical protein [Kingella potus]|uniref:hypothetical protein n=1 Tax=Kingella potus TaxID=265175 RepID=UPI000E1BD9E3|nr:hypothetical protein [Kingella potus]UOP01447.1 hypothetical protein LVJ84_04375 [Kingella potus]